MLLLLSLILATFYFLLWKSEINQLFSIIKTAIPFYLCVGLLMMLLFVGSEAFGIWILMQSFAYRLSFWKCLKYSFIGFYFSSITPGASGGQPIQVYYMKRDGAEIGPSSLAILIITVSYQAAILLIGLVMFSLRSAWILQNLGSMKYFIVYGVLVNLCLIVTLAFVTLNKDLPRRIISGFLSLLKWLKILKQTDSVLHKAEIQLGKYQEGIDYIKEKPRTLLPVFCAILIQVLSRLSVAYAVYKAFGLQGYSYLDIVALQAALALTVESLPSPGAVGAAEVGFLAVNRALFGVDMLLPAMLLSRGISYYAFLLLSGGVTLGAQLFCVKRSAQDQQE
ncbi:MAG: lysylphosphatidylglycerol synthase transmembrane domain-containing protein [Clostridia bacterium]|nr:lysylphosphatidylglycerol synthase transmembrane domain-containing protein [Clostridia bacterium]